MKYNKIFLGISAVLVVLSVLSLIIWGLNPSIDFTGGALLEVRIDENTKEVSTDTLYEKINALDGVEVSSVQNVEGNGYIIRSNQIDENTKNTIISTISEEYTNPVEVRFESVGPALGKELLIKTLIAVLIASAFIMGYVAYQFKDRRFGIAAILAMFHDTIILLGVFSILGVLLNVEVNVLFVTALLTTLSFSVHDTIVVFDRIREKIRKNPNYNMQVVINNSITETLPRSLNNSLTIMFMLTSLALLGGETIRWFAVALLVGTIAGTYSSTFVAAPLLLLFSKRKK